MQYNRSRYLRLDVCHYFFYKKIYINDSRRFITPLFNKDGWYHDRQENCTWTEYNGLAYLDTSDQLFKYELSLLMVHRLSVIEKQAIATLISCNNCPLELREQMRLNLNLEQRIKERRAAKLLFVRLVKGIND